MKKRFPLIALVGIVVIVGAFLLVNQRAEAPAPSSTIPPSQQPGSSTSQPTKPVTPTTPTKSTSPTTPSSTPQPSKTQGKVYFAVKDTSASLQGLQSVYLTISEVMVHSPTKGWISISKDRALYDLLKLRQDQTITYYLTEANLEAGTYNQLRLIVESLVVVKDGTNYPAVFPSNTLHLIGKLVVDKGKTSAAVFDFLLDKSLHITGDGKYIFLPVVKLQTSSSLNVHQVIFPRITIASGRTDSESTQGMDENGNVKVGFYYSAWEKLEIVDNKIKRIP